MCIVLYSNPPKQNFFPYGWLNFLMKFVSKSDTYLKHVATYLTGVSRQHSRCLGSSCAGVKKGHLNPEIRLCVSMTSPPCWEVITMSPVIAVTRSAKGVVSICEHHLWIVHMSKAIKVRKLSSRNGRNKRSETTCSKWTIIPVEVKWRTLRSHKWEKSYTWLCEILFLC